jgi:cytidine deaminase
LVESVDWIALRKAASDVMRRAHAPYSSFPVGAAGLVDDGRVVVGCNVENASYGLTLCAECGLVSSLYAGGGGRLVAVSSVDGTGEPLMPCGRCRQLLWEHGGPECLVDSPSGPLRMADLLPHAFDATDLDRPAAEALPPRVLQWRGRGTVFVHPDTVGGQRVWTAYWERSDGLSGAEPPAAERGTSEAAAANANAANAGQPPPQERGILEEGPTWPDQPAAVAWGRQRTPRVVVVDADGHLSWAGEGDPPAALADHS